MEGVKFHTSVADMLNWLSQAQDNIDNSGPVSGEKDTLVQQVRDHEGLQNEMSDREPDLRLLLDKGQRMMDQASPTSDISDIADKLEAMRNAWRKLKDEAADRKAKLQAVNKHAEKFQSDLEMMQAWLSLEEEKMEKADPPALDKDTVARQLKEAQVGISNSLTTESCSGYTLFSSIAFLLCFSQAMQTDLLRKSRDHEALNEEGDALIKNSEQGQDVIQEQLDAINKRWKDLSDAVNDRVQVPGLCVLMLENHKLKFPWNQTDHCLMNHRLWRTPNRSCMSLEMLLKTSRASWTNLRRSWKLTRLWDLLPRMPNTWIRSR